MDDEMNEEERKLILKKTLEKFGINVDDTNLFNPSVPSDGPYIINNPDLSSYRCDPNQYDENMDFFNGVFGPHAFDPGKSRFYNPREASGTSYSHAKFHIPFMDGMDDIFERMSQSIIIGKKVVCEKAYTGAKGDIADATLIIPFNYQTKSKINK